MAGEFDPEDKYSWYFGQLSREETNTMLDPEDSGVFLVRDSKSIKGDFVLCVKEDCKISHYIVNRIFVGNMTRFRIGDQEFPDIATLLNFYKTHYLDTTPLIRPAPRQKVVGKFEFNGRDPEDLPFKKNEILEVISKDEMQWWTCRNEKGVVGSIPVPYVTKYDPFAEQSRMSDVVNPVPQHTEQRPPPPREIQLPARAIVVQQRVPNLYDRTQLKLEKDDIVLVTKMNPNGQWEGEINGRKGIFPFTHVRILESNNGDDGT